MTTSTILSDNGVSSSTSGLKTTGGDDGTLILQTTTAGGAATTALTIDTTQNITLEKTLKLKGSTSGTLTLQAIAVAGTNTLTFPAETGTILTSVSSYNVTTKGLWENSATISADYAISSGNNAMSGGPITINTGIAVTVPTGSVWTVV